MVRDFGVGNVRNLEQLRTVSPQDGRATAILSPQDGRAVAGRGCGRVAPRGGWGWSPKSGKILGIFAKIRRGMAFWRQKFQKNDEKYGLNRHETWRFCPKMAIDILRGPTKGKGGAAWPRKKIFARGTFFNSVNTTIKAPGTGGRGTVSP